jgi:hypothetical protein
MLENSELRAKRQKTDQAEAGELFVQSESQQAINDDPSRDLIEEDGNDEVAACQDADLVWVDGSDVAVHVEASQEIKVCLIFTTAEISFGFSSEQS